MLKKLSFLFFFLLLSLCGVRAQSGAIFRNQLWLDPVGMNRQRIKLASETVNWLRNINDNAGTNSWKHIWAVDRFIKRATGQTYKAKLNYFIWLNTGDLVSTRCPIIYTVGNAIATNSNFVAGDSTTSALTSAATNKKLYHAYTNAQDVADGGCSRGFRLKTLPPFDVATAYYFRYANAANTSYDNAFSTTTANSIRFQFSNTYSVTTYNSLAADKDYNYVRSAANRADLYEDHISVANSTASTSMPADSTASVSYCSIWSYDTSQYAKCGMVYFFSGLKMTGGEVAALDANIKQTLSEMQ